VHKQTQFHYDNKLFIPTFPPHTGRPWLSISIHISTLVLGLSTLTLPVAYSDDFAPCRLSVQYTQDICGCPPAHTGRPWLSVCVRLCPSAHTGRLGLSISKHISTLFLGLSTLAFPWTVWDVRGRPWVSANTHRKSVAVISTHISPLVHGLNMLALPMDCLGDLARVGCLFSTHRTSVGVRQHTKDVCGCPWLSVSTHRTSVAVRVCPSAHTGRLWLSISKHISTLVLGPSTLAFSWTVWDVRGCPPAHTGRPWLSVAVRQHTQDVRGCPSKHTGRPWLSISTHISTLVLRLSTLTLPVDYSDDFAPRGLSVQYIQDVRGCPPAHTGRLWLSVCVRLCPSAHTGRLGLSISKHISTLVLGLSTLAFPWTVWVILAHVGCLFSTHRTSVGVHQYTYQHVGPWTQHADPSRGLFGTHGTSVGVSQHTHDIRGCPCVSVCVRQHTQDVCGCPSVHKSACWSLDSVRWPFPWTVWVNLAHVGCLFSTHRTAVGVCQHTHDVCGCLWLSVAVYGYLSAHTGRLWLSMANTTNQRLKLYKVVDRMVTQEAAERLPDTPK
ncbi:hypothetical protein IGI04_035942, partial [Brassica rapa subsp. trilocularis]